VLNLILPVHTRISNIIMFPVAHLKIQNYHMEKCCVQIDKSIIAHISLKKIFFFLFYIIILIAKTKLGMYQSVVYNMQFASAYRNPSP